MATHTEGTCGGCLTLPTNGFSSKPPNKDGRVHWCPVSQALAVEQEKTTVHVEGRRDSDEDLDPSAPTRHWRMTFAVDAGAFSFEYDVEEPYLHPLKTWRQLASGVGEMSFYMGNGYGGIAVKDGNYVFGAAPSGAGGDVSLNVKVPVGVMAGKIAAALDKAVEEGFLFVEE